MYTVYAIRCKENGKIYVGCTKQPLQDRIHRHFEQLGRNDKRRSYGGTKPQENTVWQDDYNKFGEDAFECFSLETDIDDAFHKEREMFWIEEYKSYDSRYGYNIKRPRIRKVYAISESVPPKQWENQ